MVSPVAPSGMNDALGEAMSAVMDGRATPAEWARVNAAWERDPALRERWALWHAASDGLRAPELPALHREPDALLADLRGKLAAAEARRFRRRDWFAPIAVAAGFVAVAVLIGSLRPQPVAEEFVAAAPITTPRAQGLGGMSFAQTAAGRTLGADAPPEVIDWGLVLPEPAASQPRP